MINFLSKWIEQIALSVVIVSIFELILPKGNLKKYIKVVLGMYIIFCIISPFLNNSNIFKIEEINLEKYQKKSIGQNTMDVRIKELYKEELKKDIEKKVLSMGYNVSKCEIDAEFNSSSENLGIHNISLKLTNKSNEINVEEIKIGLQEEKETTENEKNIKQELAKYYEIDEKNINVSIK